MKQPPRRLLSTGLRDWPPHLTLLMAAAILVLATMTWLTSRAIGQLYDDTGWLVHTERVRYEISRVLQELTDVESGQRGYESTGDGQFLEPYRAARGQLPGELATLEQLISDNPAQVGAVARLRVLSDIQLDQARTAVGLATKGDLAGARAFTGRGEAIRTMDEIRGLVAQMLAEEARLLDLRESRSRKALVDVERGQWIVGALAAGLLLLVAFSTVRHGRRLRQADETLAKMVQDRERQFVNLADSMPQLVWTELPDGTHEYFNRGWLAYTGLTEEESRGADVWARVVHVDDAARVGDRWERSRASGEPYEAEMRLRRHDGAYRWFLARAIASREPDGTVARWFGTCTDIDGTKQIQDTLRRAEAALRDADRRKDVFLATLSHELRNPLAPIQNAARLLEKPQLDPRDLERSRSIILRQVRHMASLLDDLLDISRITRGALTLKKDYVRLQALLTEAVDTARPLIDAKRHALITDWPSEPMEIEADPVRLVQVVSNLLTNAAKYTEPGGSITCYARMDGDALVISVRDNGVGLAPEMLGSVFEMFSQVHPARGRSDGGLGIGLALVKGMVELHGGRVEVHSAGLGQGSEFTVTLPGLRVATGTIREVGKTAPPQGGLPDRRVLVADDNRDGAQSLALLLEGLGCTVYIAYSGVDALALATRHRPHAAILDIGMPGRSGFEVAQQIRREAWGSQVLLVALTGWGQEEYKRAAKGAGFDHHLTKPVDLEALEEILLGKGQ